MHQTGIEGHFILRGKEKLRMGYTTGTCAAAAAAAAAGMLLTGRDIPEIYIMTPRGIGLSLEILETRREEGRVSCAVRKDAGDDPDVTDGILIYAAVSRSGDIPAAGAQAAESRILIDGGEGIGRVTREGLSRKVGEAAINPVPMQMIRENVQKVCDECGYTGSLKVVIYAPAGKEIAKKTFNPRLGIEGGISVLGTSGIVVPMSEAALKKSIEEELSVRYAQGLRDLVITPGNYGETYAADNLNIDMRLAVKCSNYVGETLDMALNMGFKRLLFVAHIGKFIKVAGGIMNTHSRDADCRAELMAAFALRAGGSYELAMRILSSITTDEAISMMKEEQIDKKAMALAADKVHEYLQHRVGGMMETEAILFSSAHGHLSATRGAEALCARMARPGNP